jgi:hypothetical protein
MLNSNIYKRHKMNFIKSKMIIKVDLKVDA